MVPSNLEQEIRYDIWEVPSPIPRIHLEDFQSYLFILTILSIDMEIQFDFIYRVLKHAPLKRTLLTRLFPVL
ncbi:hypothetical protein CEXT_7781 [Caerostris extrusa]|uniref:Uncharacterized protein n=1 Tax=Caerostris extrusa TaxID=172846 RepID=A0AAV4UJU5_CAEEX|nr:hypothetical protein CEXT_7781 [Caerostris extrusa]